MGIGAYRKNGRSIKETNGGIYILPSAYLFKIEVEVFSNNERGFSDVWITEKS